MQRLASSVCDKIKKYKEKYSKIINSKNEYYVIALNGYWAISDNYDFDDIEPPYILKTLFGLDALQLRYSERREIENLGYKHETCTPGNAPIAHFSKTENSDINGVLYSNVNVWEGHLPLGKDFIFIQNPYANDITEVFKQCNIKIWYRKTLKNDWFRFNQK